MGPGEAGVRRLHRLNSALLAGYAGQSVDTRNRVAFADWTRESHHRSRHDRIVGIRTLHWDGASEPERHYQLSRGLYGGKSRSLIGLPRWKLFRRKS